MKPQLLNNAIKTQFWNQRNNLNREYSKNIHGEIALDPVKATETLMHKVVTNSSANRNAIARSFPTASSSSSCVGGGGGGGIHAVMTHAAARQQQQQQNLHNRQHEKKKASSSSEQLLVHTNSGAVSTLASNSSNNKTVNSLLKHAAMRQQDLRGVAAMKRRKGKGHYRCVANMAKCGGGW